MNDIALPLPKSYTLDCDDPRKKVDEVVPELYLKLRPVLVSYGFHLTGSTAEAEDVVQLAFLQLVTQLIENGEIKNLRGWLYRVVHNIAVDHALRTDKMESLLRQWFNRSDAGVYSESSEDALIKREEIERAFSFLNGRERHSLMLRAEGLSYQEIAETLDISAKSVSVYLARGLRKFRQKQ